MSSAADPPSLDTVLTGFKRSVASNPLRLELAAAFAALIAFAVPPAASTPSAATLAATDSGPKASMAGIAVSSPVKVYPGRYFLYASSSSGFIAPV